MFRLLNSVMALLFLFGAAVQYNDPDPLRWMAIYLAASVACACAALKRLHRAVPAMVAAIALIWAATLARRAVPSVRIPEMFGAWEMANERIEEAREMYGLMLVAIYMCVLAVVQRLRARTSPTRFHRIGAARQAHRSTHSRSSA